MDRGAWQATVHRVAELDTNEWLTHTFLEKLKSSVWFTFRCYWTTQAQTSPGSCSDPASLQRTHRVSPARPEVHQQLQKVPQASLSGRFTLTQASWSRIRACFAALCWQFQSPQPQSLSCQPLLLHSVLTLPLDFPPPYP